MKKIYTTFLFSLLFLSTYSQDPHVILGKCRRNAVSGHEAFNLGNLKYYAKRSKAAMDELITNEDFASCSEAFDMTNSVNIHLESALLTEDFATAKAHLIKVEETSTEIFNALNLCNVPDTTGENALVASNTSGSGVSELERLKQQQAELKRKEKALKEQLAQQEQKKLELKKQSFIAANESALKNSVKSYNTTLKACNCSVLLQNTGVNNSAELTNKNVTDLKLIYLNKSIKITQDYLELLNKCKSE